MKRIKEWIETATMLVGIAFAASTGFVVIAFFAILQIALPVAAIVAVLYAIKRLFFN